jgi:hypothetical protein
MTDMDRGPARVHEDPFAAVERLAGELEGIRSRDVAGTREYEFGGALFAAREGRVLFFRLRPEVVSAALRTPGTARSPRGADWISLRCDFEDDFTLDRVRAWFELAWRLAGGEPERPPLEDDGADDPDD